MTPTATREADRSIAAKILATVSLTFMAYLTIGLPLAVLPSYVKSGLGFGAVLAGLAISTQYIATIVSRAQVGQLSDRNGPKWAVTWGFSGCLLSGVLTASAALCHGAPRLGLGLILAGRLALGLAESWVATGAITWAIGQVGPSQTVRIISWNGIATYGGIALGAPLGVVLMQSFGFWSLGVATCLLGGLGLALASLKAPVPVLPQERLGARRVAALVLPYGVALALASTGFGVIAAFVTLYFESRHWPGASASLSLFGISFIVARLLFGRFILRHGGLRVTLLSLLVEALGLFVLWLAPGPAVAMFGAALTGFGFAPIFPALGVVAVAQVPPQNRGAALGVFSVFLDVSLGATGPIAGLLVERFGEASPFLLGVLASLASMAVTAALLAR